MCVCCVACAVPKRGEHVHVLSAFYKRLGFAASDFQENRNGGVRRYCCCPCPRSNVLSPFVSSENEESGGASGLLLVRTIMTKSESLVAVCNRVVACYSLAKAAADRRVLQKNKEKEKEAVELPYCCVSA